jgi:hypothetical protein
VVVLVVLVGLAVVELERGNQIRSPQWEEEEVGQRETLTEGFLRLRKLGGNCL